MTTDQKYAIAKAALYNAVRTIDRHLDGQWDGSREGWESAANETWATFKKLNDDDKG
jgi:hypothetical protein